MNKITAPTWAEINLDNLEFNLKNIKKLLSTNTKICVVLKANAYGHGAVQVARFLETKGIDYIAVARLEEALELRQNGINSKILCLGYIPEESLEIAIENEIALTIYTQEMADRLNEISKSKNKITNIHLKIDTGMSRIGFEVNEESIGVICNINNLEYLNIEGIYTHFSMSDEANKEFTNKQVEKFNWVVNNLENRNIKIPIKHVSNSAATMDLSNLQYDMVRCGIVMYGYYPSADVKQENLKLKPVMTLKTTISHIKKVPKDTGISYGHKYKTTENEIIATIPIGYADGFCRVQKNPKVIIKDKLFDVVGRICMDQCMIKIDEDIDIKTGEQVIIFGSEARTADDLAKEIGTIVYEVLCMVSRRVDRVYMEKDAILQVNSYLVK